MCLVILAKPRENEVAPKIKIQVFQRLEKAYQYNMNFWQGPTRLLASCSIYYKDVNLAYLNNLCMLSNLLKVISHYAKIFLF